MRRGIVVALALLLCASVAQAQIDYTGPGGANESSKLAPVFWDDFITGGGATTHTGALGWVTSSAATLSSVANHPGVATVTPGATAFGYMISASQFNVPLRNWDTFTWIGSFATGANVPDKRVGFISTAAGAEPADDAVFFECTAADANWFAVTRDGAAGNVTRTDTGVAFSTAYTELTIKHPESGKWEFWIDGVLKLTRTAGNIPAETTASLIMIQIETNGTAVGVSSDWAEIKLRVVR